MKYIIGNWKSNKTFVETYQWFDHFAPLYKTNPDLTVGIAVPYPYLFEANKKINELNLDQVKVVAQDVSPYPFGAYTGAVTAAQIGEYAELAIVGHSERRNYFAESHLEIGNKVTQLLEQKITPIVCIDEPYLEKQLAAFDQDQIREIIIAYEPLAAIGSGHPADPKHVAQVAQRIREVSGVDDLPIIYGGSTNAANTKTYMEIESISGLLPGGSSLDPAEFSEMISIAQSN